MKKNIKLSLCGLCFILALCGGCSVSTDLPLKNPVELPENFSQKGTKQLLGPWWNELQDPGLSEFIEKALAGNLNLKSIKERLVQARSTARKTGADRLPELESNINLAESIRREDDTTTSTSNVSLGLAASYEVDLWGRVQAKEDAGIYDVNAAEEDVSTAKLSLSAEVAISWYQLGLSRARLKLLDEQQEINRLGLEIIQVRFNGGQVGYGDVLQQKQLIESKNGDRTQQQANIKILENRLSVLCGLAPGMLKIKGAEQLITLPPLPDIGVPLELIKRRSDIKSIFYELLAADRRVAAAIADRYPRLSISADLRTSGTSSDLFRNWLSSIAANLMAPLFDGGARVAEVDRTKAVAREKLHNYGQVSLEAIAEVENALIRELEQRKLIASLEKQLELATRTVESVRDRYKLGGENYQRVLSAILSQQGLQRDLLIARERLIEFRISLYRAIGGNLSGQTGY